MVDGVGVADGGTGVDVMDGVREGVADIVDVGVALGIGVGSANCPSNATPAPERPINTRIPSKNIAPPSVYPNIVMGRIPRNSNVTALSSAAQAR